ncbi:MAG: glycosyltransferase, partial [Hyphomicrobiales bacterium]|nr:glycosyltransferase [Hyphomicrobiales bacterium]
MKALIWVQHLLGSGHVVRAAAIGRALAAEGIETVLATGAPVPETVDIGGLTVVDLPPVRARDAEFSVLVDGDGKPIDAAWDEKRRQTLLDLFRRTQPDILMTECFPFGRRRFRAELVPLLEEARASEPRPLIAASVRDILVRKADPDKERQMAKIARDFYDLVLVHADPALTRFEETFPPADEIDDLIRYTGYVHAPADVDPLDDAGTGEVIVSCGGGAVGTALLETALAARSLSARAGDLTWRILVGRDIDEAGLGALRDRAGIGIVVERARSDFPALLRRAAASISQAGYNTVLDVVTAGVPAVLV